jgi:hypothetical protein
MLRVLPVMDDIVREKGDQEEDQCPGQDRVNNEIGAGMSLYADKGGGSAGGVDGAGYVHEQDGKPYRKGDCQWARSEQFYNCHCHYSGN